MLLRLITKYRWLIAIIGLLVLVLPVWASAPAAPIGTTSTTTNFASTTVPVAIPTGPVTVSDTITVSGLDAYILDVDMSTFIPHAFAADLDITLTSPAGTVVTITTDNGAGNDNVFNGTVWDDDAGTSSSDALYTDGVAQTNLVPEEAMGAFIGEDPNGVWTLTISDDLVGDGGSLDNWSLDITTLDTAPLTDTLNVPSTTVPVAIPTGPAVVSDTITVSGAGVYLLDLNMTTFITHTFGADLDITLTSPAGTVVTITTDNGAGNDNVFNGTVWDDDAGTPASDAIYANGVAQANLTPEEAMGAFIGENPNGVWTLTISDDLAGDGGSIDNWSLDIVSVGLPVYASSPAIGAVSMNTSVGTAVNQSITVTEAGDADLLISAITLTGDAEISLVTNPAPFTISDGSGTSQAIDIECSSATAGTFTATLEVSHNAKGSPAIYTISCRVRANAAPASTDSPQAQPSISFFDPAISKIGFLVPGQTGVTGEVLEWVVTVSNTGSVDGQNVTITDTLNASLRLDRVDAPNANVSTNGQTVTVAYPILKVGETVQFSIFTTVLNGATVDNTACVNASNQAVQECATALPVAQLPSTGEAPLWRGIVLAGIVGLVLAGLLLFRRRASA